MFHSGVKRRSPRQVRERWINFLNPELSKEPWNPEEEATLVRMHSKHGNKWAKIAKKIPKRNENQIKNHWISICRKNRSDEIAQKVKIE